MITYGGKKQSANIKNPKFIAIVLIKINICRLSQLSNIAVNLLLYFRNPPSKYITNGGQQGVSKDSLQGYTLFSLFPS